MKTHMLIAVQSQASGSYFRTARRWGKAWILGEFVSYDQALAAFQALDGVELPEGIKYLAVRSVDDPAWRDAVQPSYSREDQRPVFALLQKARRAAETWRSKQISEAVNWAIREHGTESFHGLEKATTKALAHTGITLEGWALTDAVKARVLVGRCWPCDRAYWMPKKQGPLHKARCPVCGSQLHQTTLALRKVFHRLPA